MQQWKIIGGILLAATVAACSTYENVYDVDEQGTYLIDEGAVAVPCQPQNFGADNTYDSYRGSQTKVQVNGVKVCPPHKRCDGWRLPPQPCVQPMPSYYGDVSAADIEDGVVLIHPYTRTQIICFDTGSRSAQECAERFRAEGYVLITDLPQLPARYDLLKEGNYPARRWRGGGEVVPRW